MAISQYSGATNFIAQLPNKPVTDGGYTAQTFKEEFDKFGTQFKNWFNGTFIPALNNTFQTIIDASHKLNGAYISDGTIKNAQISASAAIAGSKLASGAALANIGSKGITAAYIADTTITGGKIANTTIPETKMANINVSSHLWQVYVTQSAPGNSSPKGIYLVY